ncbi:unnamed protein product [Arabidopsis thaliana]|uniref:Uncharacterized protein n=3 Tax=Arabidopsis TaxID=3701 RepID=A0A654FJV0_ARATH|nr:uncharacterized protein AT3G61826 [Arabidopsis thaliana]AEE80261.1 hypothetical protein AT3G61826 [Arabidopsis thaliana]KAG7629357.1 hypothetical protein ISN45_At03g054900 [Arabidopsis thaliana x Arabidopsis arenosa]CAA0387937.1 unnamed protein product [Arabidopsis thaliana]VYS61126.1 unnamed protein product [Arabidopsis thaliana]|eukprot:NP_001118882.1 hypothetical protein AT3G61826 [Arabidopsis thaliana]
MRMVKKSDKKLRKPCRSVGGESGPHMDTSE